jgi:hypothetical protein
MYRRIKVDQQVRIVADLYKKSIKKNYEKRKNLAYSRFCDRHMGIELRRGQASQQNTG